MLLGKIRALHLVSLGAAISVLSIAFSSFAQQVVTFPLHQQASAGNATTPLVTNLTGSDIILQAVISAALFNGLAINGSTSLNDVTPVCSTGNCVWAEYHSLGVCATIFDISSSITNNSCDPAALDKLFGVLDLENPGYPCFNYSLPFAASNSVPTTATSEVRNFTGSEDNYGNVTLTNVVPLLNDGLQFFTIGTAAGASDSSFISSYMIYQPDLQESIHSSLANPVAYSMSLGLCMQRYNTTVTNGITSTSLMSSQVFDMNVTEIQTSFGTFQALGESVATVEISNITFGFTRDAFVRLTSQFSGAFIDNCFHLVNQTEAEELGVDSFCTNAGLFGASFIGGLNSSDDPLSIMNRLAQNIATSMTNS